MMAISIALFENQWHQFAEFSVIYQGKKTMKCSCWQFDYLSFLKLTEDIIWRATQLKSHRRNCICCLSVAMFIILRRNFVILRCDSVIFTATFELIGPPYYILHGLSYIIYCHSFTQQPSARVGVLTTDFNETIIPESPPIFKNLESQNRNHV